jgi:4,5-dihydroxyphthalate decarboxylase
MKVLPFELTTVTRTQGANAALKDGSVTPAPYAFQFEEVDPLIRAFRLMVREQSYDVCELAITTYLCAKEHGKPFTALPVFLVRGFHHGAILCNRRIVSEPKDLEGKRVGVNRGYTVTTGVWARGVLGDEYGVDLDRVTWVLSGDEHVAEYRPPANVVAVEPGQEIGELLAAGELAAAIGVAVDHPDVAPLVPDAAEAGFAALRSRGHYPINHLVVVRDELLAAHPDLAGAVFRAFEQAKNRYVERLAAEEPQTANDRMLKRVLEETGADPLPYGIEPNRRVLEELVDHALRQRILTRRPELERVFAGGCTPIGSLV